VEVLEIGDVAVHGEEAFPEVAFMSSVSAAEASPSTEQPHHPVSASAEE
jgi:hypothetical protein